MVCGMSHAKGRGANEKTRQAIAGPLIVPVVSRPVSLRVAARCHPPSSRRALRSMPSTLAIFSRSAA